jgi:hypothetical protein
MAVVRLGVARWGAMRRFYRRFGASVGDSGWRRRCPPCYGGSGNARTAAMPPTDRRSVARARVRWRAGAVSTRLGVGTRWGAGDLGQGEPWAACGLGRRGRGCRDRRRAAGDERRAERATPRRATLWPKLFYWCSLWNRIALNFCIEVDLVMNTKVVDLAI